jgi:2'-5' RNA ligase
MPVTLAGLGVFPGNPPVVWAVPAVPVELFEWHRALHAALSPLSVHPHYRPGSWVPHVTLGQPAATAAIEAALAVWDGPLTALLDRVELVRFPPAAVLRSIVLPSGA